MPLDSKRTLTDSPLQKTGREALEELDESKGDKVGEERSGGSLVLLVGDLGLEDAEGEEGGREKGKECRGGQRESKQVERDQEEIPGMSARDHERGTKENIREDTAKDEDNSIHVGLLLQVPDCLRPAEDLSQLADLLLRGTLGVLNSGVLSGMVKLRAEAVDPLSEAGRRRCGGGRRGGPGGAGLGRRGSRARGNTGRWGRRRGRVHRRRNGARGNIESRCAIGTGADV